MSNEYWGKRLADKAFDRSSQDMLKELRKIYQGQAKSIQDKITDLYMKMLEDGGISTTNLYAYGRYTELVREINGILKSYGEKEVKIISGGLEDAYKESFGKTSETLGKTVKWGLQNTYLMEEAVNANFKGANFSQRIWNSRDNLSKLLEKNIQDTVASGQSKDKAVRQIMEVEKSSFRNADRLVRTETMRVINDGQKQSFKINGYTHGYYIYSDDDRNCEECARISNESRENPLLLESMDAVHHPNCRCTIRPVVPMRTLKEINTQLLNNKTNGGIISSLPDAENAVIPRDKIFKYALVNEDKARAFKEALGYDLSNGNDLIEKIKDGIKHGEVKEKGENNYGRIYEVKMRITGVNGKTAAVKTGWIEDNEKKETRLTSVYVAKKKGR